MFPIHTYEEIQSRASAQGHFGFVFEEDDGREVTLS